MGVAHKPDEWVTRGQLLRCTAFLQHLIGASADQVALE
jgi:acetylornithine deacetylase/succinyl-diaminopimelate desuccinylase-like protein